MFILKKGHQPGVYVPLRALFLVNSNISGIIKARSLRFSRLIEERCTNTMHTNLLISDFIIMNNINIKTTNKKNINHSCS